MNNIYTKRIFAALLCIVVTICLSSWGFRSIVGAVTNPIGAVTGIIGGVAGNAIGSTVGNVVAGAASPTIDKFGEKTDEAIKKANSAMEERLVQVKKILSDEATQVDTLVSAQLKTANKMVTEQLSTVDKMIASQLGTVNTMLDAQQIKIQQSVSEAISDADDKIQEDINNLDEITELRIGQFNTGLTFTSYYFTLSIWQIVVGFAQLVLVILFIFFVLRSTSIFMPGGINQSEITRILNSSKIYGAITLVGLILISIYNPIKSKTLNRGYAKVIGTYEEDLDFSSQIYDYRKSAYDSYILSELDKRNDLYDYYKIKYELLKDLTYRPKLSLFASNNIDNITNKLNQLGKAHKLSDTDDPEYYIVVAMYFINAMRDRDGDIIAFYLCNKALNNRKKSAIIGSKPLDVFALNIIKNQSVHPYTDEEIHAVIKNFSIDQEVDDPENIDRMVINDTLFNKLSAFSSSFQYNSILQSATIEDEKDFLSFVNAEVSGDEGKLKDIGNKMINRWINVVFNLKNIKHSQVKLASSDLNDSYVQYVTNFFSQRGWLSKEYISLNDESNNILNISFNGEDPEKQKAIKNCSDSLTLFKKYIVSDILALFSIRPKIALSQLEVNKARSMYRLTSSFASNYKSYLKGNNKESLKMSIALSAIQGIYSRDNTLIRPLCLELLDKYIKVNTDLDKTDLADFSKSIKTKLRFSRLNFL